MKKQHFDDLNLPFKFKEYWTKYPHGFTIFEALVEWVSTVNDMVDNINDLNVYMDDFINQWQGEMKDEVLNTLTEWQQSGFLEIIINQALETRMDDIENEQMVISQSFNDMVASVESEISEMKKDIIVTKTHIQKLFSEGTIFFAHRGLSSYYPENTLLAFEKAVHYGFKGIELDVCRTSDNEWIVMHDLTMDRMTNMTGDISNISHNQVRSANIDSGNGIAFLENKKVPNIDEVLILIKKYNIYAQIEIKTSGNDGVSQLVSKIKEYNLLNNVLLMSFDYNQIQYIRGLSAEIMLLHVVNYITPNIIEGVKNLGNCGISANYAYNTSGMKNDIKYLVDEGIPVGYWTVDILTDADRVAEYGGTFVTTNKIKGALPVKGSRMYTFHKTGGVLSLQARYGRDHCTFEIVNDSGVGGEVLLIKHQVPFDHLTVDNGISTVNTSFAAQNYKIYTKSEQNIGFRVIFKNAETGVLVSPTNIANNIWFGLMHFGVDRG